MDAQTELRTSHYHKEKITPIAVTLMSRPEIFITVIQTLVRTFECLKMRRVYDFTAIWVLLGRGSKDKLDLENRGGYIFGLDLVTVVFT